MTDFSRTREALRVYDEGKQARDKLWDEASNGSKDLAVALKADADAEKLVSLAFYEDSKHVNSYAHASLVHPDEPWLRKLVALPLLPEEFQRCLLMSNTSRHNKLWLLTGWLKQYDFRWKWQGAPGKSRMMFAFHPMDGFTAARSYEEDVLPTMKWAGQ